MPRTPIHPGEILAEELADRCLSINQAAAALGVPPNRIGQICSGKRSLTADTALRLARFFGSSPEFWMNLQSAFDLDSARATTEAAVRRIEPLVAITSRKAARSGTGSAVRVPAGSRR